tara:strand:+ start:469 stop:2124 length:1656 start_codon:yes stop_codon:yes gene_type:complete
MKKNYLNLESPPIQKLNTLLKYYQNKKYLDAETLALSIVKEFPNSQFAWKVLGVLFKEIGRIKDSLFASQKSVKLRPNDAEAHNNLGVTLQELKKFNEAEKCYRKAIDLNPKFIQAIFNLGNALKELNKFDNAVKYYEKVISLKPDYSEAHNNLGFTYQSLRNLDKAEACYRKAVFLKPNNFEAHNNLGVTLQELGKFDEAETCYRKAIDLNPHYTEAHRHLTLIKKFDTQDEQYLLMKKLYQDNTISDESRCQINFGLAKAYEDLENFEKAFKHYHEGNKLRKNILKYDINKDIKFFNKIKKKYVEIKKCSFKAEKYQNELMPIFIIGMPRSGTTLVEQIISSHPKVTGAGELPFVSELSQQFVLSLSDTNEDNLFKFKKEYLTKLKIFSNENKIITDKMPQNFFYLGLLTIVFPEAKIVHVKRDPAAVCWANFKAYFLSKDLAFSHNLNDIIKYYSLYKNLMVFWKNKIPNRIYDICYETLTSNQEVEIKKLINYIGLSWDEKCLAPQNNKRSINTASNVQIRKKIYQGSSERWKKFKPFLNGTLDNLK